MKKNCKQGDRPPRRSPSRKAAVNLVRPDSWCLYADGFRRAAELLIEYVNGTYEINTVIFPIFAVSRQYVELSLKEIIAYGQYLEGHTAVQGGHDLDKLWAAAKSYVTRHYKRFPAEELKRTGAIIEDLYRLDPSSEGSRYPSVKRKKVRGGRVVSFAHDVGPIDLEDFAKSLCQLGKAFKEISDHLSFAQALKAEFSEAEKLFSRPPFPSE